MTQRRDIVRLAAASALAASCPGISWSQTAKVARLVVPFPAGGATDAVARLTVEKLRPNYPNGFIVENRPGASGRLGVEYVKNSEPDGLTMLFTPDFVVTVFPHIFPKLSYHPLQDFAPVALCAKTVYAVVAGPAVPMEVSTIQQFLEWARANPAKAAFGSGGAGSVQHFTGLLLGKSTGTPLLHVAYKGGALALQDVIGGQIPISVAGVGEVLPYVKSNRVRVLATTGATRNRFLPDTPTLVESGLSGMAIEAWVGILVPARTPPDVVARTSDFINAALQRADLKEGYSAVGMDTVTMSPAAFASVVQAETARWAPVVKASGFTAEE